MNLCFCVHILIVITLAETLPESCTKHVFLALLYLLIYTLGSQNDQGSTAVVAYPSSSQGVHLPVWSSLRRTCFGLYCSLYCCVLDKSRVALSELGIADICMTVCMLDHNQKPFSVPRHSSLRALRETHLLFIINNDRQSSETEEPHLSLSHSLSHLIYSFSTSF